MKSVIAARHDDDVSKIRFVDEANIQTNSTATYPYLPTPPLG